VALLLSGIGFMILAIGGALRGVEGSLSLGFGKRGAKTSAKVVPTA
jgi:hypothetical protein